VGKASALKKLFQSSDADHCSFSKPKHSKSKTTAVENRDQMFTLWELGLGRNV